MNGRDLLDGTETTYYERGRIEHEVTYALGRKTGREDFFSPDGIKISSWQHDLKNNRSVWTQFWPDGKKKVQSTWNTAPEARDLMRRFFCLVADGPAKQWSQDGELLHQYNFTNGVFAGELPSSAGK